MSMKYVLKKPIVRGRLPKEKLWLSEVIILTHVGEETLLIAHTGIDLNLIAETNNVFYF